MRKADFGAYREALLVAGIAPRHVRRTITELRDHHDDLCHTLTIGGRAAHDASADAFGHLGTPAEIAAAMSARRELKCWYFRWPRLAGVVYVAACIAALPALPLIAGRRHAALIGRWGVCLLLSAGFTVSLLLAMQLSIQLS